MAAACERVIGLFDGTKWHRSALLSFVPVEASTHRHGLERPASWSRRGASAESSVTPASRAAAATACAARDLLRGPRRAGAGRMTTMVAVDLGAQSGRVALGRFDGERLSATELHRFPNVPVRSQGTLHWDVLALYAGVLEGLRRPPARPAARSTPSGSTPGASTSAYSTAQAA